MNFIKLFPSVGMASCALLSPLANAADAWSHPDWANSAWYIGAGVGGSKAKLDESAIADILTRAGATSVLVNSDQRDTGYKLYLGKQFNSNLAFEAGWFDLGRFGFDASAAPIGTLSGRDSVRGWNLDMLLQAPFSQQVSMYGRLGAAYARSNSEFSGSRLGLIVNPNGDDRKFSPKVGLGLEYKFNEVLALRGEVERYRVNSTVRNRRDIDVYSLNLVYKFGQPVTRSQVNLAPAAAPAPAPLVISETRPMEVARAPEPPPPAPVATSEKVSFAAEALFDFDKSVLKTEGKTALDEFMQKLQGMTTEVIVTVGHTDSVGSDEYNQKLSMRRAEAVKAWLTSKNIDAARVFTEGKGENEPIVDNKSAENRAKNRRVTVEVVGTRTVSR